MEAIKAYIQRIKDLPILEKDEEITIIRKAKRGDRESRRKIINSNLKLVVNISKHYTSFNLSLMDLIAEGNIGLMRAIDKFDISRGYRFSTYAAWWIRQAITRSLIDQGKTIRIPVYMSEFIAKYRKSKEALRQKLHREPARGELAKHLRTTVDKISEVELWTQKQSSLDAPVGTDGESQLSDFVKGEEEHVGHSTEIKRIFNKERVNDLLDNNTISEREKDVLNQRFGITDGKPSTLAKVSLELGISRERVRQIEKEALGKLRKIALADQKEEI
ncbi:MAG: RNA polymerase sigma factor RpoD/SigA [Candidatus Omnitrophota bacterium]